MEDSLLAGAKVLIVEDEPVVAVYLSELVIDAGGKPTTVVGSVLSALGALDAIAFDFAIVDIKLKGEISAPVAERLVQLDIPFVIATGYQETPAGFPKAPTLRKPFTSNQLQRAVSTAQRLLRRAGRSQVSHDGQSGTTSSRFVS